MKNILILLFVVLFSGCVYVPIEYSESDRIVRDPSYLLVAFTNPTGFYLRLSGELEGELGPYESVTKNLTCPGTHRVLAHAYKEIGRSANGKYAERIFVGEQNITFYVRPTDSYNHNGMVVSAVVNFGSFYLNPRYPFPNQHIINYAPCSIFTPNLSIQKR